MRIFSRIVAILTALVIAAFAVSAIWPDTWAAVENWWNTTFARRPP